MKAIKSLTVTIILSVLFTSVNASAQKDADTIDWSKVKPTKSATLDSLVEQVRLLYEKVFLLETVATQIQSQLNGTAQVNDLEKLIDQTEQFTKEFENFGTTGAKFLELAGSEGFIEKIKKEVPVVKYLRALKNAATVLKAAKIITEKTKSMLTIVIPVMKEKATALKKAKSEKEATGKL